MLHEANFLFEIGSEEIPAGYIPSAVKSMHDQFSRLLEENRVDYAEVKVFATPRRIAIMASGVALSQRSETAELKGPAKKAAYDSNGKATGALNGFMKANGLVIDDVFERETEKGVYIFSTRKLESKDTVDILPRIVDELVKSTPFPKRMKWSDKTLTYPRPIRYFLMLFDDVHVPFEMDGIYSSQSTRGHYIQNNKMIPVNSIKEYGAILTDAGVVLDQESRRSTIEKMLNDEAAKAGYVCEKDDELLDIVTFLVEKPHVVVCSFKEEFLDVPDIALVAEMREHQKYFALRDSRGQLVNRFLTVSNNPPTENIRAGNERVITARFNDARFFFLEDRKKKLEDIVDSLKDVLFHRDLGSIYDKIIRMKSAALGFSEAMGLNDARKALVERAVMLSKTDLNTAMVYEFASLQGKIGRIYALLDGEAPEVAEAIENHYRPRFQGDDVPDDDVSICLSLAEKIDNIFGSFSVGNIPKGSADPYALRRQANAVVDIIIKNEINVELRGLLESLSPLYKNGGDLVDKIIEFVRTRAKTIFTESGFSYDEIDACLSTESTDFLELHRRAESINRFRKEKGFSEMLLGFKRMNNIVSGFRKENPDYQISFKNSLLKEEEEKALYEFFKTHSGDIGMMITESRYLDLFKMIINGKPLIDSFFDKVLVMDKDIAVRDNRISLLEGILSNFTKLMNFSRISDK